MSSTPLLLTIAALMSLSMPGLARTGARQGEDIARERSPTARLDARRFSPKIDFERMDAELLEEAICLATNEAREAKGLSALPFERHLARAARSHARRMARYKFFGHADPRDAARKSPEDRARRAGVENPYIAENVAVRMGLKMRSGEPVYVVDPDRSWFSRRPGGAPIPPHTYRTFARAIVAQWMESTGHRENILSESGQQMGCGVGLRFQSGMPRVYGVQVFQWFQPVKASQAR